MSAAPPSEEINGEEFAVFMRLRGDGPSVSALRVVGPVELSGAVFERDVLLSGVVFEGRVVLAGARFLARLSISNCQFRSGLDLASVQIAGELVITSTTGERSSLVVLEDGLAALDLRYARVGGGIRVELVDLVGALNVPALRAEAMEVKGSVALADVTVACIWPFPMPKPKDNPGYLPARVVVDLDRAQVGGSLHLAALPAGNDARAAFSNEPPALPPSTYHGTISARSVQIGGDVVCGALRVGQFALWNTDNSEVEAMWGPPAEGAFCLRHGEGGHLDLSEAAVSGSLLLRDTRKIAPWAGFLTEVQSAVILARSTWGGSIALVAEERDSLFAHSLDATGARSTRLQIVNARVVEQAKLSEVQAREMVWIHRCVFGLGDENDSLVVTGLAAPDIVITCCVIVGNLVAGRVSCAGILELGSASPSPGVPWIKGEVLEPSWGHGLSPASWKLCEVATDRTEVTGHVHFWGSEVGNQIRFEKITIGGSLAFSQCRFGDLRLGLERTGGVSATELIADAVTLRADLRLGSVQIGQQDGKPALVRAGSVQFRGCRVGGDFDLGSAVFYDQADLENPRVPVAWKAAEEALFTQVRGTVLVEDCTIAGDLSIRRLDVTARRAGGPAGIEISETEIGGRLVIASPAGDAADDREPSLQAHARTVLEAGVDLEAMRCRADTMKMRNSTAREAFFGGVGLAEGLEIANCTIRNRLYLSGARIGTKSDSQAVLRSVSAQDLSLSDVDSAGPVMVAFCTIARSLDLRGLTVGTGGVNQLLQIERTTLGSTLDIGYRAPPDRATTALALRLIDVEASDVDLTGLRLTGSDVEGSVSAAGLKARLLRICPDGAFTSDGCAHIPGALDLSQARLDRLIVGATSFGSATPRKPARQVGIVLQEARIDVLELPRRPNPPEGSSAFPVPLDLRGLVVREWVIGRRSAGSGGDFDDLDADDYLDVLDNDERINRPLYQSIARQFRETGRDREAVRLYVAEVFRAQWEPNRRSVTQVSAPGHWAPRQGRIPSNRLEFGGWSVLPMLVERAWDVPSAIWHSRRHIPYRLWPPFHFPFRWLFRYGADLKPALVVILVLAVTSFGLVARNPANFELTPAARQLIASADNFDLRQTSNPAIVQRHGTVQQLDRGMSAFDDGTVLGPKADEWTVWSALWTTVRYHVPVINLVLRDDYVATDDRCVMFPWSGARTTSPSDPRCTISSVTPEDWFGMMAAINWVLWPLVLTFLVRRLVRS